jgi:hypothetical protein
MFRVVFLLSLVFASSVSRSGDLKFADLGFCKVGIPEGFHTLEDGGKAFYEDSKKGNGIIRLHLIENPDFHELRNSVKSKLAYSSYRNGLLVEMFQYQLTSLNISNIGIISSNTHYLFVSNKDRQFSLELAGECK